MKDETLIITTSLGKVQQTVIHSRGISCCGANFLTLYAKCCSSHSINISTSCIVTFCSLSPHHSKLSIFPLINYHFIIISTLSAVAAVHLCKMYCKLLIKKIQSPLLVPFVVLCCKVSSRWFFIVISQIALLLGCSWNVHNFKGWWTDRRNSCKKSGWANATHSSEFSADYHMP